MRDIINNINILSESTGLANRKPGDVFKDSDGNQITFNNLVFYPEQGGRLEPQELDMIVRQVEDEGEVIWLNNRTSKSGGLAIATFSSDDGNKVFGRYLENIKPNFANNFVPNKVLDYRFAGKSATKITDRISPQDLLTAKNDLSVNDILSQLEEKLGTDNILYQVASKLAKGHPLPMTFDAPNDISFSGFRDYFCEILQPIALQMGQYTGNAGEAAEIFLNGSFQDTLISFDDSKTAGLSDSVMTNKEAKYIKVSTKGGMGAMASTSNLIDSIEELSNSESGRKLVEKYQDIIDMLKEIKKKGQVGAPLYLGVKYDIIDLDDAKQVMSLKNSPRIDMTDLDNMNLSDNLVKLAKEKGLQKTNDVDLFYHILSSIAHKAAEKVNNDTDFSKAATDILNNGALVQMYTKAKEGKDKWTLSEFNTVYPGDSIKGVFLSASKTYYSTGINGNFTFKIDKGKGVEKDSETDSTIAPRPKRLPTEKEFTKKAADIALGRTKSKLDTKPTVSGDVGRAKRK
jgi:hypothetical protein